MKIGILTGGGDCPGLNQAIRGCVVQSLCFGNECIGILEGWKGLYHAESIPLPIEEVDKIVGKGGTIVGTSRFNLIRRDHGIETVKASMAKMGIDALVAMGGEDTLGVASRLFSSGVNIVGVPKTIDNDLFATDYTFGFHSAVSRAVEACESLIDTGTSHRRIMVAEVMGRHAGWVAAFTSLAAGADWCIVPEFPNDYEAMYTHLAKVWNRKKTGLVIVSEGVELFKDSEEKECDDFGHRTVGGVAGTIADMIQRATGIETRSSQFGHIQRGGSPTVYDRILGLRVGVKAAELIEEKKFGMMACLRGDHVEAVSLEKAVEKLKTLEKSWFELAHLFFY